MDLIQDTARWKWALTVPQISQVMKDMGIIFRKPSTKQALIEALIAAIMAEFPDVAALAQQHVDTYGYTSASYSKLGLTFNADVERNARKRASRVQAPQPVRKDHVAPNLWEPMMDAIVAFPDHITVDGDKLVSLITPTSAYGYLDPSDPDIYSCFSHRGLSVPDRRPSIPMDILDRIRGMACLPDMLAYVGKLTSDLPHLPYPVLPNITTYEVLMDGGVTPDRKHRFPRVIYGNSWVQLQTIPFGLSSSDIFKRIVSIDGKSPSEYVGYYDIVNSHSRIRKLLYLLSTNPEVSPMVDDALSSPYDKNPLVASSHILNMPTVAAALSGIPDISQSEFADLLDHVQVARRVPAGVEMRIFRYLSRHPEVTKSLTVPATGCLPYYVEDYIPEHVWNALPSEILDLCNSGKHVDNPYEFLSERQLNSIAEEKQIRLDRGLGSQMLGQLDMIQPEWAQEIYDMNGDTTKMSPNQLAFYAGSYGIRLPDPLTLSHANNAKFVSCVVAITNAGGIGIDEHHATPSTRRFISELLSMASSEVVDAVCAHFKIPDHGLLDVEQIQDIFIRGYINPVLISDRMVSRSKLWDRLTDAQRTTICDAYGIPPDNKNSFCRRQKVNEDLEAYIVMLSQETLQSVIDNLGFVVGFDINPMTYVLEALPLCSRMIRRQPNVDYLALFPNDKAKALSYMTDREIISLVNVYLTHTTRASLLAKAADLLNGGSGFFISYERSCYNKRTIDDQGETCDQSIFLVSYGTLKQYMCYQLDELNAGFTPFGVNNGLLSYRILDHTGHYQELTSKDAASLSTLLLSLMPNIQGSPELTESANAVIRNIKCVARRRSASNAYDIAQMAKFDSFTSKVQASIFEYLKKIFEVGMYQRRWAGPPNPYPVKSVDTMRSNFNSDLEVIPRLLEAAAMLVAIRSVSGVAGKFVDDLLVVRHGGGKEVRSSGAESDLASAIEGVSKGELCIRIMSGMFVGTGAYYAELFCNYQFPHYDKELLQSIS